MLMAGSANNYSEDAFTRQSGTSDSSDDEASNSDHSSVDKYLEAVGTEENISEKSSDALDSSTDQTSNIGVKIRNEFVNPKDTRKKRNSRQSKRRTMDDLLLENGIIKRNEAEPLRDSNKEEKQLQFSASVPNKPVLLQNQTHSKETLDSEFKKMLDNETSNSTNLKEIIKSKKSMLHALGKHVSEDIFESLNTLNTTQECIVSVLRELCANKGNIEDLLCKLVERQKILTDYGTSIGLLVKKFKAKLQIKTSSSFQRSVELLKKPLDWTQQTKDELKRIEKCLSPGDANYDIVSTAQDELLDISGDFVPFKQTKEPLKYSVLVELRNPPNGDRKLASVFLYDDVLISARQRVITLRKHFTQESDSETGSNSANTKEQSNLMVNTKTIRRYEIMWFIPLDQLESLDTNGIAFDDDHLRERLRKIERLKKNIVQVQEELREEMSKLDKESRRQKLKIPKIRKIHRLRSYLYNLQAELVLQSPKLPLFINKVDGSIYCFLMASEKERINWKSAITNAKNSYISDIKRYSTAPCLSFEATKPTSAMRSLSRESHSVCSVSRQNTESEAPAQNDKMKNELSALINHSKKAAPLNTLGKVLLSGNAVSGVLEVCVHEISGLADVEPYYVAIEVDFHGQIELVAKTKSISGTTNPCWNQTFMLELETSQTICFTVFRHSTVLGQLELPLEEDQIDRKNAPFCIDTGEDVSRSITLTISLSYNKKGMGLERNKEKKASAVFGQPIGEVLKRDQENLERLQMQITREKKPEALHVPVLVTACIEEVERRGLQEEGIYRLNGSLTTISYLQDLFDQDIALAIKQLGDYEINVISGLLKLFFRSLPEALIPPKHFGELVKASEIEDEDKKISEFGRILETLPSVNLDTFRYLLDHLIRVCECESNRMEMRNLSLIWAVVLFQPNIASPIDGSEASGGTKPLLSCILSVASISMIQTGVLATILDAYAQGKLRLSTRQEISNGTEKEWETLLTL